MNGAYANQAVATSQTAAEKFLTDALGRTMEDLPTLPDVALRIMQVVGGDGHSARDLAHEIGRDPSLASKVLRAANSPYYGHLAEVDDLNRAVVVLGFDEVRNLAVGIAAFEGLRSKRALRRRMQRNALWAHSQHVAILSELLGRQGLGQGGGVYVHGLLHDIGKVALDACRPAEFDQVLDLVGRGGVSWRQAEREVMGLDHGEVGGALLEYWNFPPSLVAAARLHHQPWEAGDEAAPSGVVYLADTLAQLDRFNVGGAPKSLPRRLPLDGMARGFLAEMGWTLSEQSLERIGDLLREHGGGFEPVEL